MVSENNQKIIDKLLTLGIDNYENANMLFEMVKAIKQDDLEYSIELAGKIRESCTDNINKDVRFFGLYNSCLLYRAPYKLDDYILYIEKDRPVEKQFYLPRRKVLKTLVDDLQDLADGKIYFLGISLPPRIGKELANSTPILTKNGWKKHGDLVVGDYVLNDKGKFVRVTHVFPKCKSTHVVKFADGEEIQCHANHEWVVWDRHANKLITVETKDMIGKLKDNENGKKRNRYSVKYNDPLIGEEKELPVKPYSLGAWLGDGTNITPCITSDNGDKNIADAMTEEGYIVSNIYVHKQYGTIRTTFKELRSDLQKVNMCYSHKECIKHIPEEYFTASLEQRLELLAGLIDTDGTLIKKEHRYRFSTTEEQLKDDFISLISTFGWRTSVTEYDACLSSSGIQGRKNVFTIGFNPTFEIPCRLERKQLKEFSKQRKIAITEINEVSDGEEGNCISVEGGIYLAGKTLKPTHNSTLCIFFMTWVMSKNPDVANVMSGHSDKLTKGFYQEILSIVSDDETYNWNDVFPNVKLVANNQQDETVDLNRKKRFPSITCRSMLGTLTGAVEVGDKGCLYLDDAIEDLEESLNMDRLDKKYDAYLNQLRDRMKDGAFELQVGTRWNVFDIIGRIKEKYADDPRYRFRVIPALNEDGESNFDYDYGVGFSTEYYLRMKSDIDDATWWAKYMGQPYIREGLIFPKDELKYYNGVLPCGQADRILTTVDVAFGGGDCLSAPIGYVYGDDVYIHDVVFNSGNKEVTQPLLCGKLISNNVNQAQFEANNGGDFYADDISIELKKMNYTMSITSKRADNQTKKLARIIQYAPDIKRFHFRNDKDRGKEYDKFMEELNMIVVDPKGNKHDDSADSLRMMAEVLQGGIYAKVTVRERRF